MSMSDPIADMLTRIRNAAQRRHRDLVIPSSKTKAAIAAILQDEGFIENYEVTRDDATGFATLRITLKYASDREPVITRLERVSKPGRRVYKKRKDIPWVLSGMGIAILTTPKGVMTDKRARQENVGGEVLCYIW
jgi:small subunit ribosomal protein S8